MKIIISTATISDLPDYTSQIIDKKIENSTQEESRSINNLIEKGNLNIQAFIYTCILVYQWNDVDNDENDLINNEYLYFHQIHLIEIISFL